MGNASNVVSCLAGSDANAFIHIYIIV